MFSVNHQRNYFAQLLSLAMATAVLMSIFAVTNYSATYSRSSRADKTNRAPRPLAQPQTPVLKANGKIAFAGNVGNNYEIFVMNSDGSGRTQLTSNGFSYNPAFSPDGNTIAFYSGGGINRMNADGSNQIFLASASDDKLSWSPDGRKIAYTCDGICVVESNGSNSIHLSNDRNDSAPGWSPDGTKIAFTSNRDNNKEIYVMNVDGSNPTRLTNNSLSDQTPDWSPDGMKLAFSQNSGCITLPNGEVLCFSSSIFVMNADGSNQTLLTGGSVFTSSDAADPTWSPDGTKIAFQGSQVAGSTSRSEIFVINANGGNRTNLTNTADVDELVPDWGPVASPPATCINSIDCAEPFVRQHYLDFLNRTPDTSGLAFWTNEITSCGGDQGCIEAKRINVSAAYFLSIEFQQTGYLVYRIYKAAYGNLPNAPVPIMFNEFLPDTQKIGQDVIVNQTGWEQVLENNKQAFAAEFVQRARFTSAFPTSLTPAQFVDRLFANAGLATLEQDYLAAVNEFGSATDSTNVAARAHALRRVAENSTLAQQEFNKAFVLMQYFGYLRRNPNDPPEPTLDYQGYNFWLNKLNSFNGSFMDAEMVKAFILSGEYRHRFGP